MARVSAVMAAAIAIALAIVLFQPVRTGGVAARPPAATGAREPLGPLRSQRPTGPRTPAAGRSGASAVWRLTRACPVPTAHELRLTLSASTTAAADRLTASAAVGVVAEDGAVIGPQTGRVDIWWDLDFHRWWSALTGMPEAAGGGPSQRVASVAATGACTFSASFAVPDSKPGPHVVVAIAFDRRDGGAAAYVPAYVVVR
jgi:hypothetical protein